MNPSSRRLNRSFLVGVLILSTAYGAQAVTVERTSRLIDGVYVPVLVVMHDGQSHVHVVGQDGLTRSILYNQKKALAWARDVYGPDATVQEFPAGGDLELAQAEDSPLPGDDDDDDDDDDDEGGGTF